METETKVLVVGVIVVGVAIGLVIATKVALDK